MILVGDCLATLATIEAGTVQTCVTSPPYFALRDYGIPATDWPAVRYAPMHGLPELEIPAQQCCLGLEETPEAFVGHIVHVFREVARVLRQDGTLWLNMGDSTASSGGRGTGSTGRPGRSRPQENPRAITARGLPPKNLLGMPWRVALALQADGWILRQDVIWHKRSPMPETAKDRPTRAHEYLFLFSRSRFYKYDWRAIAEPTSPNSHARFKRAVLPKGRGGLAAEQPQIHPGRKSQREVRNKRTVWTLSSQPFRGAHFATFPERLVEPCVLACTDRGDVVLDPFLGSGTVGVVATRHGRRWIGCEINAAYAEMAAARLAPGGLLAPPPLVEV